MLVNNTRRLFLIDGLGALLSTFFLAIVLVRLEIGMPKNVLYFLATLPSIFAIFSFGCYFYLKSNLRLFLRSIAISNFLYCCLTIGLIANYYESLTALGLVYFLVELLVLGILITVELTISPNKSIKKS